MELGETMADNLVAKGVTASASDGLTTLAGKILDIQTGGSCYHIELNESAYTTTGSLTVTATLQNQYQPYANQTVTFTGGTSTVTATTDSNGVATATVTFSASGTLTASYSNVSDTATVTVQTDLFYDACDTDNTNLYDTTTNYSNSTLTFDSSNSCYVMSRTSSPSGMCSLWIKDLTVTDQVKITADMKLATTGTVITQGGPIIMNSAKNKGFLTMIGGYRVGDGEYSLGTTNSPNSHGTKIIADQKLGLDARNYWFTYELIIDGSSVELNIYNGSTLIKTGTITSSQLDSTGNIVGLLMSYGSGAKISVKNIKVEPI